jgi:hypothetical protein
VVKPIYAALIVPFLIAVTLVGAAGADDIPHCQLPSGASFVALLSEAPSALQRALRSDVGDIVEPGEMFDSTDVVTTGQSCRLNFVWNVCRRWVVATEHGGVAYNDPIFVYDLSADGQNAVLVESRTAFLPSVCSMAVCLIKK